MPLILPGFPDFNKVVISLCDYTAEWPRPWNTLGGYTVLCYDLKHGDDVNTLTSLNILDDADNALTTIYKNKKIEAEIAFVLSAPPCTDFAVSGARWWKKKDESGETIKSLQTLFSCYNLSKALSPHWWCLENPVGRIPKLFPELGNPKMYFNPSDYAGWATNSEEETKNRYTKKTGLWGRFMKPRKIPLDPIRVCNQGSWVQKLGGKSEKTKALRSTTPSAFARAFYEANYY